MQGPPIVVGGGRVGAAIARMLPPHPAPVLLRGERVPELPKQGPGAAGGPVWVCTTNDALDDVLDATPPSRRCDLILVQNGMLLPWMAERGLAGATQVLLYMAANADGSVTDGRLSLAHGGRWAAHAASALRAGGVSCREEPSWCAFQEAMVAKLLWSSIFWAMSAALDKTVGGVATDHAEEVGALVAELLPLADACVDECEARQRQDGAGGGVGGSGGGAAGSGAAAAAGPAPPGVAGSSAAAGAGSAEEARSVPEGSEDERRRRQEEVTSALLSYSLAIAAARPSKDMALREWRWRNGWFLTRARTPLHAAWLRRAGCGDRLDSL